MFWGYVPYNYCMTVYTYYLCWTDLDLHYYGLRYASQVAPEADHWKTYFSSSKRVKQIRMAHGDPDVI